MLCWVFVEFRNGKLQLCSPVDSSVYEGSPWFSMAYKNRKNTSDTQDPEHALMQITFISIAIEIVSLIKLF